MEKKKIILVSGDPKFLFINQTGTWAAIVGVGLLLEGGTPQVPESEESDDADCDATYVGVVSGDFKEGVLDLSQFELPPEAVKYISENKGDSETCRRCGGVLTLGFCGDETCPFSSHEQSCPKGWAGHPLTYEGFTECTCDSAAKLRAQRVELAERWYMQSDMNGNQIKDVDGWENGESNELKRTIYVERDDGKGDSVAKTLHVYFPENKGDEIIAAYLPGTDMALRNGKDTEEVLEVDGSAGWK